MSDTKIISLQFERERLMKAWRTAESANKMAILVRIDDIDDQLGTLGQEPANGKILTRRFTRR